MKIETALFLMIGAMACARGEINDTPRNECITSSDCEASDMCRHQDCIYGRCVDVWKDQDQDGYVDMMCGAQFNDCNDTNVEVRPGVAETCDCEDNDCDKTIDNGCNYQMKVLDKSTEVFGCFAAKSFRSIDEPSNIPSHDSKPRHNTIFINATTEGWGSATVWYYGRNNKRYLFPSESVFESWFGNGADKCCLVRTVANDVFNSIETAFLVDDNGNISGGKVCYRPDAKIWKIDPPSAYGEKMFVVTHGCGVREIASEAVAEEIFGPDWKKLIDFMPYVIFKEYLPLRGLDITSRADFDLLLEQSRSMTIDNNQDL